MYVLDDTLAAHKHTRTITLTHPDSSYFFSSSHLACRFVHVCMIFPDRMKDYPIQGEQLVMRLQKFMAAARDETA